VDRVASGRKNFSATSGADGHVHAAAAERIVRGRDRHHHRRGSRAPPPPSVRHCHDPHLPQLILGVGPARLDGSATAGHPGALVLTITPVQKPAGHGCTPWSTISSRC